MSNDHAIRGCSSGLFRGIAVIGLMVTGILVILFAVNGAGPIALLASAGAFSALLFGLRLNSGTVNKNTQ